jgi:DNA repair protein RecO (recombination protein O)
VCKNAIKEKEENIELFDFIFEKLKLLDSEEAQNFGLFPIKFLLELSQYIGFMPLNNFDVTNPYFDLYNGRFIPEMTEKYVSSLEVSQCIASIDKTKMDSLVSLSVRKELRNQVIDDLIIYYRLHIEQFKELKTLEVLRTIF